MATVITLHVHISNTEVVATDTVATSVGSALAVVLDYHPITATTLHALVTHISVHAIYTEN